VFWSLYAGLMGFVLGASFFFGMYGRNMTEGSVANQHEKEPTNETARSKKDEADEALAFYTLWLMAFTGILAFATIGLGGATVLLYATGEKQFKFAVRSSIRQFRDMRDSVAAATSAASAAQVSADAAVAVERGRLYAVINHNFLNCIDEASAWDASHNVENPLPMPMWPMAGITFKNYGKTPAIIEEVGLDVDYSEVVPDPVWDVPVVNKNIIGPGDDSEQFGAVFGQMTMAQAIKVKDGAANIWVSGYVIYDDIFGKRQTHRFFQRLVRASQFRYVLQSYDHKYYNQSS
jgi:hypothetical protein